MAEHSKQTTIKQHTVPRCYLRGFADLTQNFYSFNKRYKKAKSASVRESAQSDYFYDFDPSTLQNPDDDPQWAEKTFSVLETRFKEVLDNFITEAKTGEVGVEWASCMAQFVAIQWLRTRGARDTFMEIDTKVNQAVVNQLYALNYPGMKPGKFVPGAGYEQALHAELMFDYDHLIAIAERFWNLLWVIGRNRTEHPFYTSDEPVVRRRNPVINETSRPVPPDVGLEFAFPLNNEFVLVMLDRRMFSGFLPYERKTMDFGPEEVERYNTMQVMKSTQYVFCSKQDFDLAERLCDVYPVICDPNRDRAQVDSSLDRGGTGSISVVAPD
jgi:Protein of unknown function (DUF4238)